MAKVKRIEQADEPSFTKKACVKSSWFKGYSELLSDQLDNDTLYTRSEVESIIKSAIADGWGEVPVVEEITEINKGSEE